MSPTRFPRIRMSVPGVGFVQLATRARTERDHQRRVVLFRELVEDAQVGVIRALLDGRVAWEELIEAKRGKKLSGGEILGNIALERSLFVATVGVPPKRGKPAPAPKPGAVAETLPKMGRQPSTRRRYTFALAALERQAFVTWEHTPARVADLATIDWHALADAWVRPVAEGGAGRSAADWNNIVRAVSAFLAKYLGSKRHPFRLQVMEAIERLSEDERVPDLTPSGFRDVMVHIPEHVQPAYFTLLLTGLRVQSEYLRLERETHLLPATCQVLVPGRVTKTKKQRVVAIARELWPWVDAAVPAPVGYLQLRRHWMRACLAAGHARLVPTGRTRRVRVKRGVGQYLKPGEQHRYEDRPTFRYVGLRMHDLRHALGQWAEEAGVPLTDIQGQLGHAVLAMTARYSRRSGTRRVANAIGDALATVFPRASSGE